MKKIAVVLLFLLVNKYAFSQTVNLEQARTLALANSTSLAKYESAIRSSVLDEKNQLYSMLPQVSADYRATMGYLKNWEFINPIDAFTSGVSFSITQIIFQGGKSFINKAISGIATESVRKDAQAEYFNTLDSADNAYYAVLEAASALEAEEASLQTAVMALSIAEVRQQSGMINRGDYLKALADKEMRENSRNQARRTLVLNMAKFKTITGLQTAQLAPIDFTMYENILSSLAEITDEKADELYAYFWNIMACDNPSLAKAALGNKRAEMNYTLSKRDYAPTISATIFSSEFGYSPVSGFNNSSNGGISINGKIPVDFWVLENRLEKSKIARDTEAINYTNTQISLEQDLLTSLSNVFTQAGSVLSSRRSLEYTESHFNYVMERYRLSQSSVADLNDATSLFISARNSLNRATYSFLQSISRIRSLCAMDDEKRLLNILSGDFL
ncbi:TolC family protein [Treponema sp. R80B11-R83G3]